MLKQRIITALVLAPLVLCGVFLLAPQYFSWFVAGIVVLGAWEWANLSGFSAAYQRVGYALLVGVFVLVFGEELSLSWVLTISTAWWALATVLVVTFPDTTPLWKNKWLKLLLGVLMLIPLWKALVFIREAEFVPQPDINSLWLILYMLLVVWGADTGAYFAGKAYGKKKLAPQVSPGKSWAGAWGGMAASAILAIIAAYLLGSSFTMTLQFILITLFTAAISIVGDLTESMFKRERGIKDSSSLLPGHGGILDRIDSLVAAVPVFIFALYSAGWVS